MTRRFTLYSLVAGLLVAMQALAQQMPDGGRLLEQVRPEPALPQREIPKIDLEERPALQEAEGARIDVAELRVTGATLYSVGGLHALVADGEGKQLSLGELGVLAARITRYYRERGYLLARAYLPAQEVKNGSVEIAVLEGRLGQVQVDNRAGIGAVALAPLSRVPPGEITHQSTLDRGLLLLSDVPGVEVKSTLRPGASVGTSDLLVDVSPTRRVTGSLDGDNFGDRFSGEHHLGATVNFNNPARLGDQASVRSEASDEGMKYLRASYQFPFNAYGTRVGAAASELRYHLGKTFATLDAEGSARIVSFYLLHPLVRSRNFNLNAQLQYDSKNLEDRINSTATVVNKTLDNWMPGINGDFVDKLGGGGANTFSLIYSAGRLSLDPISGALDAATAHTQGSFSKWNLSWLRVQRLAGAASLYLTAAGQHASKNLDSAEKMSLGGANGVRAYPQGEAPGDVGQLFTMEVRYNLALTLPGAWQVFAFMDGGHVKLQRNVWATGINDRTLKGAGFGFTITQLGDWSLKTSIAWKVSSESPTSDIDRSPRAWLRAVKHF